MKSSEKIKVGIIGAGRIGRVHTENLMHHIKYADPVAISDINIQAARDLAAEYGIDQIHHNYQEIINNPEIGAILICSATDTHYEIIHAAAAAGKHIFCEKPLDLDLDRILKINRIIEDHNVKLQVGFNRRFDVNFMRLKQAIAEGKIGAPQILKITSRDPCPPPKEYVAVSGGIFLDMTIHDFDMARFLMDSEIVEVYAVGDALIDPSIKEFNDIDTAVVSLRFENGSIGTIDNSRQAVYGYDQRVEVFGSQGMVHAENNRPDNFILHTDKKVESSKPLYFFMERYTQAYLAEIKVFIDIIAQNEKPPVSGVDGLMAVKAGLAAGKSLAENRPVRLDEIG